MAFVETFVAAAVAGFGFLLAAVALMAWRRAGDRKMAVLGLAFAGQGAGGAVMLVGELGGGVAGQVGPLAMAVGTLAGLVLLYGALFARRK
jgi:hypothetical protein